SVFAGISGRWPEPSPRMKMKAVLIPMESTTAPMRMRPMRAARPKLEGSRGASRGLMALDSLPASPGFHHRGEDVAARAHRLDQGGVLRVRLDLAPEPADLDVDAAVEGRGGAAAGEVDQLVAGEHALGPLRKRHQEIELA